MQTFSALWLWIQIDEEASWQNVPFIKKRNEFSIRNYYYKEGFFFTVISIRCLIISSVSFPAQEKETKNLDLIYLTKVQ